MNKKKFNIILIPGVIIIWIIILMRIFSYSTQSGINNTITSNQFFKKDTVPLVDTIILFANYRDPFLNSNNYKKKKSEPSAISIKPVLNITHPVSWPNITYEGTIKVDKVKEVIMTLSGKKYVLRVNQEIEGIKIIECYPDSIKVKSQKEIKTIPKN